MNHYMIDIETLSTDTNAHVLAIAMVKFTEKEVLKTQVLYPDPEIQHNTGRKIDFDTLNFWMKQPELLKEIMEKPTKSLSFCSAHLRWFIDIAEKDSNIVWAKSPSFDLMIMRSLFSSPLLPWKFSNERDVRTAYDKLTEKGIELTKPERAHDPLSDALAQVANVQKFLNL
jgi:hypothetical protein